MGKAFEPVFAPLGFNWKGSVALLSGIPAKEIIVSTMGVLYTDGNEDSAGNDTASLPEQLKASGDFNTASVTAFLLFILIYLPCIATIAAIGSEAGWKWAAASVFYSSAVAWLIAYAAYNLISLFL